MGAKKAGFVYCCPRCVGLFDGSVDKKCPFCGFDEPVQTECKWEDYEPTINLAFENPAIIPYVLNIHDSARREFCLSSPHYSPEIDRLREAKERSEWAQQNPYTPRCPTCGSPDLSRAKIYFSFYPSKIYHCNNCGYRW